MFNENTVSNEKPLDQLIEFIPTFQKSRLNDLEMLIKALEKRDFKAISAKAHSWKGFADPYGYPHLATLAQQIELASKSSDHAKLRKLLSETTDYLALKQKFFKKFS